MGVRETTKNAKVAKVRLGDVARLIGGGTPSKKNESYYNGDIPWASVRDMKSKIISETEFRITQQAVAESATTVIPKGEIVISTHVGLGKVCVLGQDTAINQDLKAIVPIGNLFRDYLYHWFVSQAKFIASSGHGATVKGVSVDFVKQLQIPLPPFSKQKRIAEELDRICELKKNAEERLALMDQLVKSRFVEMFGDGQKFEAHTIDDMCVLVTDGEHATPRRVSEGVMLLSARNVHDHEIRLGEVDYIDEEEYARIAKRIEPREGDVLLSCSGSVGRCCSVPAGMKFQLVRSVALLRFKNDVLPKFAEYLLCAPLVQRQIDKLKTASSQANLFQGKIRKLMGFLPPLALQREFAAFVAEVDKSKAVLRETVAQMETLYKAKLQEYFG